MTLARTMALVVVAAAALAGAATSVTRRPYADRQVAHDGPVIPYGFSPRLRLGPLQDPDDVSIFYATRWKHGYFWSERRLSDLTDRSGQIDLSYLISTARPSRNGQAKAFLDRIDDGYNSLVVVRDERRRRDQIFRFRQVGLIASGAVTENLTSAGPGAGRIYVSPGDQVPHTLLVLGGTDGGVAYPVFSAWAAAGLRVISIPWTAASRTPGCLDRIDLDGLTQRVDALFDAYSPRGRVSVVGFSGGADAALMIANRSSRPYHSVHAIAPTAWHFNGDRGPGCALPSSPWSISGRDAPYILNFPVSGRMAMELLQRQAGGLSQRTLAERALNAAGPARRAASAYEVSDIRSPTWLYAGGLDDVTVSDLSVRDLCRRIANAHCQVFPFAGHDILGAPAGPLYCRSPHEALHGVARGLYCRTTHSARAIIFRRVIGTAGGSVPVLPEFVAAGA